MRDVNVQFIYSTEGPQSKDYFPLLLLSFYLDKVLYKTLRIEYGLSYAPDSGVHWYPESGLLSLKADVELDTETDTIAIMNQLVTDLLNHQLDEIILDNQKRWFLLGWLQSFESNDSYVDFYVNQLDDFKRNQAFRHIDAEFSNVDKEDLYRVIDKYLGNEKKLIGIDKPVISFTQLSIILTAAIILLLMSISYRLQKKRRSKNTKRIFSSK